MHPLTKPSDRFALVGVIDPDANTAATYLTAWVDAGLFEYFCAIIAAGDLGSSATIDAKLRQATDSSGTGAKDITGKAITQLTQAGTDRSNKQATISLESEDLDIANNFRYVALSMTVGTATSDSAGFLLGFNSRYDAGHAASVIEEV